MGADVTLSCISKMVTKMPALTPNAYAHVPAPAPFPSIYSNGQIYFVQSMRGYFYLTDLTADTLTLYHLDGIGPAARISFSFNQV